MNTTTQSLGEAHQQRAQRAVDELEAAASAPALFKPEFVERATEDLRKAREGMRLALR